MPIVNAFKTLVGYITQAIELFAKLFDMIRNSPLGKFIGALDPNFFRQKIIDGLQPGSADAATNPEGDTGAGGGKPGIFRRGYNALKRGLGLGDGDLSATPGSKESIRGKNFTDKAPGVMKRLMADFGLTKDEAAIVLGNLGHESAGFTAFEEGGNGPGRGWAQWTDPGRKRRFFEFARRNNLDPKSDEANYGFLKWELENTHKSSIRRLKRARTYDEKMIEFEADFEGAGKKNYQSRFKYAQRAREAYDRAEANRSSSAQPSAPSTPAPARPPIPRQNMTPGGFNVDDWLRANPMGSQTSNNNSRSVQANQGDINVNIQANGGNPDAMAASFRRAAADVQDMQRRNVTTALR